MESAELQEFLSNASRLEHIIQKNAANLHHISKSFEEKKDWASAYFFLVTSMEEAAKYFAYHMWSQTRIDSMRVGPADQRFCVDIDDEKIEGLFKGGAAHHSKRITLLTQLIMALLNTHDMEKRKRVWTAIRAKDYRLCSEIEEILSVYNKVWTLRNLSLYVERDGTAPEKFKEDDYRELAALVEKIGIEHFPSQSHMACPKNFSYKELEKNIESMLKDFRSSRSAPTL